MLNYIGLNLVNQMLKMFLFQSEQANCVRDGFTVKSWAHDGYLSKWIYEAIPSGCITYCIVKLYHNFHHLLDRKQNSAAHFIQSDGPKA